MSNLILVRHGQSTWNLENRFTGWVDVDLSENGIKEAEKSGHLIGSLNLDLNLFFTSYLKRAIKTLEIILNNLKKSNNNIIKAWELNERHYGELTGLNKEEMKKKLGEEQIKNFRRSWDISPPPMKKDYKNNPKNSSLYSKISTDKIPTTESLRDTYNRVIPYFEEKIEFHLQKNKSVLISAHGNSLRALCKKIFKISDEKIVELEIPTGNPLIINFDQNLQVSDYRYLDKERQKNIIFNK